MKNLKLFIAFFATILSISVNSQVINCHSIGMINDEPDEELAYEKCHEQFIISQEFNMATLVVFKKDGDVNFTETFELYDYEEKVDEITYTLKHKDSSDYKYTELNIYSCVDCKKDEIMIMVTITKDDDSEFAFFYRAYWWELNKFKP